MFLNVLLGLAVGTEIFDDFTTYNSSAWEYADHSLGTTDGCKVWYLKSHSRVDATLSSGGKKGLNMLMSASPCKEDPAQCKGAKMTADHLTTVDKGLLYGDYELEMRAPYAVGASPLACNNGVYAYFTAGYVNKDGTWNEMNFGFHPDRDNNGTSVSCEHHDDEGGYHETTVALGFNYRETFNTFIIRLTKTSLAWLVVEGGAGGGGVPREVHSVKATLTQPMSTRIIMRTNYRDGDPGYMPDHVFEIESFKFTPLPAQLQEAGGGRVEGQENAALLRKVATPQQPMPLKTSNRAGADAGAGADATRSSSRSTLNPNGLAFQGFDVISCTGKGGSGCVPGYAEFVTNYTSVDKSGAERWNTEFRFANEDNLIAFENAPASFAPQFGGFDALAIATNASAWSKDHLGPPVASGYGAAWRAASDGKVYVFSSLAAAEKFVSNLEVMKARASIAWDSWFGKSGLPPYNVPHGPFNDCCFV